MGQKIQKIKARKILNSRGEWTLEVLAETDNFKAKAGVPSGASTGKNEAKVIDVDKAIKNVNEIIAPKLKGLDPTNQKEIDQLLIKLDGTEDKSNLGANAIVGVSIAIAKLGAKTQNIPLWQHINNISKVKSQKSKAQVKSQKSKLPLGAFNIVNGGVHAGNNLNIQEFMIVPQYETFAENLKVATETYHQLKNLIKEKIGNSAINIGDEGGFAPPISSTFTALELLMKVMDKNTKIILDCAATQFKKDDKYLLESTVFTSDGLLGFYKDLVSNFPIIGLEDPFEENDWQSFQKITIQLGNKIIIIGDDLLTTNPKRIKQAHEKNVCNGVIIKINQIGTVSETIEAVNLAKSFGWKIIVSHRSGETNDDFIADFAVGIGADFIKAGAPARGERVAKYNRLLEIEEEISR